MWVISSGNRFSLIRPRYRGADRPARAPAVLAAVASARPYGNPRTDSPKHRRDLVRARRIERRGQRVGDRRRAVMHRHAPPHGGAAAGARVEQVVGVAAGADDAAGAFRGRERAVEQAKLAPAVARDRPGGAVAAGPERALPAGGHADLAGGGS